MKMRGGIFLLSPGYKRGIVKGKVSQRMQSKTQSSQRI